MFTTSSVNSTRPMSVSLPGVLDSSASRRRNSGSSTSPPRTLTSNPSPWRKKMVPFFAPISKIAELISASNTASRSRGERLITRSTSAVAACWRRASASSRSCSASSRTRSARDAMSAFREGSRPLPRTGLLLFNHGARTLLNESIEGPSGVLVVGLSSLLMEIARFGAFERPTASARDEARKQTFGFWSLAGPSHAVVSALR